MLLHAGMVFINHMDTSCQVLFYLLCYVWKDVFRFAQKFIKNRSGVHAVVGRSHYKRSEGRIRYKMPSEGILLLFEHI